MNQVVKITDVCGFQGGTQPPKSVWTKELVNGYIRMLQIRDFTQPEKNNVEYVPNKKTLKTCESDDVLIGRYGASVGKICTGLSGAYNVALIKTVPDKTKLSRDYLLHLLKGNAFQNFILNVGGRAAQAGFNKDDLDTFVFFLPHLDQQKKIASILDAADAYRQKTKALITKYDELTQSLFLDMFGDLLESNDSLITLEELCGKGKYGSGASATEFIEGSPRYIRITDINEDGSLNDKVVSPDKFDIQYLLSKNDLVFARTGATVGKTYLYDEKDGDLIYAGYLIKFKIPEPHNAKYFFQFTKTQRYKAWVNNQQNVVAQPNINAKQYGNELQIPVPPIDLQNQFADSVKAIETQKKQAQASLVQAEDLFNSLLQRAFKGDLV